MTASAPPKHDEDLGAWQLSPAFAGMRTRTARRRIAVIGLPFFASRTAGALRTAGYDARFVAQPRGAHAWPAILDAILRADLVYAIGSSVSRSSPLHLISLAGKPIVLHWVGSDVQVAEEEVAAGRGSKGVLEGATHWADAAWLVEELEDIGVTAVERLLPVPAAIGSARDLPETFRVLIYLPTEFQSAYAVEDTLRVVEALPDVPFMVAGGYRPPRPIPNLEVLGFVNDMPAVYARSTMLLRLANHDGMSHSVIEALSFGRYVGWSYPIEGGTHLAGPDDAVTFIRSLANRAAAGTLTVNEQGAARVHARYAPEKMLKAVRIGLDRLFC